MESGKKKAFFIGIGGIGMSAIASIMNRRNVIIAGSNNVENRMTEIMREQGMTVHIGHSAENITSDIDLIVYTNAVPDDNPELVRARELGLPIYERAKMLDETASTKFAIGISGTHGKTTTTSMVSKIFLKSGADPSLAVGGYLEEIEGSGYEGQGKYFIYEACEAFGSMLHLRPDISVITNIDNDHLDYYGSLKNIKNTFRKFMTDNIPPYGMLIYNKDDTNLREVVAEAQPRNSVSVGVKYRDADFTAEKVKQDSFSSEFTVKQHGKELGRFKVNVPGVHNVYNALLAVVTAKLCGIPDHYIEESLGNFKNAKRRFQLKLQQDKLMVIDDYAHHPSEIKATLSAARKLSDNHKAQLIAVFQPHLYSRTEQFYKDFARSLSRADKVVLTEIYAAREENIHNISTQIIYDEVVKMLGEDKVIYSPELEDVPSRIKPFLENNSIIVTLGAGDVWKVSEMFTPHTV